MKTFTFLSFKKLHDRIEVVELARNFLRCTALSYMIATQEKICHRIRTGAGGHMEAQPVSAGNVSDAELLDDPGGHGALAGGRRAQYYGPEGRGGGGTTRGDRYHEVEPVV